MKATNCTIIRREIDESDVGQNLSSVAREHVQSCERCRDFYDGRRELRLMLGSLETVPAPSDFEFRVRARLANSDAARPTGWFGNHSFGIPAATVAALVLLLGVGFAFKSLTRTDNGTTASRPEAAVNTERNQTPAKEENVAVNPQPFLHLNDHALKADNTNPVASPESQRRLKPFKGTVASQRPGSRLATLDLGTLGAPVVKQDGVVATLETSRVFAIETPSEPLRVSLDYETGISRTISLPTLSFGSQRSLGGNSSVVKTSTKGVW
jgi:hypothetical protein